MHDCKSDKVICLPRADGSSLVYDEKRSDFEDPEGLEKMLRALPLDKKFIDWVVDDQEYIIIYMPDWNSGKGLMCFNPPRIWLGNNGESRLIDLTLAHELIHISVPDKRLYSHVCGDSLYKKYEEVIDRLAETYVQDIAFLDYAKEKIPSFEVRTANNRPIS
jgi:hypothetical protein